MYNLLMQRVKNGLRSEEPFSKALKFLSLKSKYYKMA